MAIMSSKSAKPSLPSPSRSASSMTLSHTSTTSSSSSSDLVSRASVSCRSSLQMKLSVLKSAGRGWVYLHSHTRHLPVHPLGTLDPGLQPTGTKVGSPTRHLWTPRSTNPHSPSAQTPSMTASTDSLRHLECPNLRLPGNMRPRPNGPPSFAPQWTLCSL